MFGKKKEQPEPIRRDRTIKAIKAHMDFESMMDRNPDDKEYEKIQRKWNDSLKGLTKAEVKYMYEAQKRHNY